jgi:hypothetical protein
MERKEKPCFLPQGNSCMKRWVPHPITTMLDFLYTLFEVGTLREYELGTLSS